MFVFLSYRKYFLGTQKSVRISHHGKRAIGVRVIKGLLYLVLQMYSDDCHETFQFYCHTSSLFSKVDTVFDPQN